MKEEQRLKEEEEERKRVSCLFEFFLFFLKRQAQQEEESKFGFKVKQTGKEIGSGFKNLFKKADDKISQQVDGKHKTNGGIKETSPRNATSPRSPRTE